MPQEGEYSSNFFFFHPSDGLLLLQIEISWSVSAPQKIKTGVLSLSKKIFLAAEMLDM